MNSLSVLLEKLWSKTKNHFSLAIIVAGAGSFFLTNIILRSVLTEIQYGEISLLLTYFSFMYIFGLFGFEQVFMRLSNALTENKISTQSFQIKLINIVSVISTFSGTFLFKQIYPDVPINSILLFISSYSIVSLMWIFTVFRINSNFFLAQVFVNSWKIILFLFSLLLFCGIGNIKSTNTILSVIISLNFIVAWVFMKSKIDFVYNKDYTKNEINRYFFHFFLSILIFSILSFGDRFLFNELFGIKQFGDYYFLCNFFLAPFSIFQNYIGFKQIIQFKQSFSKEAFKNLANKALFLGILLAVLLVLLTFLLNRFEIVNFDFLSNMASIFLLLLIGITRLYYATIAALFEAIADENTLKNVNIYFLFFLISMVLVCLFLTKQVNHLILIVLIIWIFRCFIFKQMLFKQINFQEQNKKK